jgi:SHS2 domain-containing protein
MEHTADIKFKVIGKTLNEIFENAVLATASYLCDKPIKIGKTKLVAVSGTDEKSLLSHFLDEILYLIDAEGFITGKADVKINGNELKAKLYGDSVAKYDINQIKAATYAEMEIKKIKNKNKSGFEAIFVLDV